MMVALGFRRGVYIFYSRLIVLKRNQNRVKSMAIEEVLSVYRYPWQNADIERLNGSIRRERTDHVIV